MAGGQCLFLRKSEKWLAGSAIFGKSKKWLAGSASFRFLSYTRGTTKCMGGGTLKHSATLISRASTLIYVQQYLLFCTYMKLHLNQKQNSMSLVLQMLRVSTLYLLNVGMLQQRTPFFCFYDFQLTFKTVQTSVQPDLSNFVVVLLR